MAPPTEGPENRSQSPPTSSGQSKSRDQRRSKRRDRSGPARSYAVVGFSALLGGPGEPGDFRPTGGSDGSRTSQARSMPHAAAAGLIWATVCLAAGGSPGQTAARLTDLAIAQPSE